MHERPKTRGDCAQGPRPCPWVGCVWNNFLRVRADGSVKLTWPGTEPDEVPPEVSCALDVADRGGVTIRELSDAMGVVPQQALNTLNDALAKLRRAKTFRELQTTQFVPLARVLETVPKRRKPEPPDEPETFSEPDEPTREGPILGPDEAAALARVARLLLRHHLNDQY